MNMKMIGRGVVVIACYGLSVYGIIGSALALLAPSRGGAMPLLAAFAVMLFAWVAHVVMSVNWVIGRRIGRFLPLAGTLAGLFGLLYWPVSDAVSGPASAWEALKFIGLECLLVLPCLLLAIHLVRFHLGRPAPRVDGSLAA